MFDLSCLRLGQERIAIVAAHPDDEVIGAGGLLSSMPDVFVLVVTDGAPMNPTDARAAGCASREEYAALRRHEMIQALALADIAEERPGCFGLSDQQASHNMVDLSRRLADWLRKRDIGLVLTNSYEMGHPDHDAVAVAVHAAAALIQRDGQEPPQLVEFTSYHRGPEGEFTTGLFASGADPGEVVVLDEHQQALKRSMFKAYSSQQRVLAPFGVETERFRAALSYDFNAPAHLNGACARIDGPCSHPMLSML